MARVLITGARAAVALELARNFHRHGHDVHLCDALKYPLARNTLCAQYHRLPAPTASLSRFAKALIYLLEKEGIEYIVPTCEEVFYLAAIKDQLPAACCLLCSNFALLKALHSKWEILEYCADLPVRLPQTRLLDSGHRPSMEALKTLVVKREFSRFGCDVLLNPGPRDVARLCREQGRFLLQEKIIGREICCYAIACEGELQLWSAYEPLHRLPHSAAVYFQPLEEAGVERFLAAFCRQHRICGQISFDLMAVGENLYVLECNPRASSGLHLLAQEDLFSALTQNYEKPRVNSSQAYMLSSAMLSLILPRAILHWRVRRWWRDYRRASDVLSRRGDRRFAFYTWLAFAEIAWLALRRGCSLRRASTLDIEWDGEEMLP